MATCPPFQHDSKPDPQDKDDWRNSTTTCTRCGEVRNALTGRLVTNDAVQRP